MSHVPLTPEQRLVAAAESKPSGPVTVLANDLVLVLTGKDDPLCRSLHREGRNRLAEANLRGGATESATRECFVDVGQLGQALDAADIDVELPEPPDEDELARLRLEVDQRDSEIAELRRRLTTTEKPKPTRKRSRKRDEKVDDDKGDKTATSDADDTGGDVTPGDNVTPGKEPK